MGREVQGCLEKMELLDIRVCQETQAARVNRELQEGLGFPEKLVYLVQLERKETLVGQAMSALQVHRAHQD